MKNITLTWRSKIASFLASLALISLIFNLSFFYESKVLANDVLKRSTSSVAEIPLVDIKSINPNIEVEMRYFTDWNFLGRPVAGYQANKCLLTPEAALALSQVQLEVSKLGLSILVFDCYRPQKSVTDFLNWAQDSKDQKMKTIFYPEESKDKLFEQGYIAERSGHSRGSTIDLTLIKALKTNSKKLNDPIKYKEQMTDCRLTKNIEESTQLDMGTSFDCFSILSNTSHPKTSKLALENRMVLKNLMEKHGFVNYSKEWWHYTLKKEPNKKQHYDFDVR